MNRILPSWPSPENGGPHDPPSLAAMARHGTKSWPVELRGSLSGGLWGEAFLPVLSHLGWMLSSLPGMAETVAVTLGP